MGKKSSRFTVAVHILVLLAVEKKTKLTTSEYLARSANTHPVVIRRILAMLGQADLVVAQPGVHGGIQLARPAAQISLLEIYRAVEEQNLFSFGDRSPNPHCICGRSLKPVLRRVFDQAEQAMENALANITVAEIAHEVEEVDTVTCQTYKSRAFGN
jgi:Rrf2 family protein